MSALRQTLTRTLDEFVNSEKTGGLLLIACAVVSIALANSALGEDYLAFWHTGVAGLSVELWVNDALMALFFLLVGLELERELYVGELSSLRNALLPIIAAAGGIVVPALIHLGINAGTPTQAGMAIPTATDIAFALGILSLLGRRVPASLKASVVAFAVMDDLCAIVIIALFYTADLSLGYLLAALAVWGLLCVLNRRFRVMALTPYLIGGVIMWYCMLQSGVHATVAGVLLAFAIPFAPRSKDARSPSHVLEHMLQKPVAFIVLPVFALANTAIVIGSGWLSDLAEPNSLGIILGLFVGKPIGIVLFCLVAVGLGLCRLPADFGWRHLCGTGMLGGIGFTMSIFITNLAFIGQADTINTAKFAILLASTASALAGFTWLRFVAPRAAQTQATEAFER